MAREAQDPPPGFPVAEALEAWNAYSSFWAALAADDDQAAGELLYAMTRLRNGFTEDGLAAQLRERMGLSIGDCASMGLSTTVRVLPDGSWAFMAHPIDRFTIYSEPTEISATVWIVIKGDDGRWQMWGAPTLEEVAAAELVPLPVMPPPQGRA